jgi:hypothetical protein
LFVNREYFKVEPIRSKYNSSIDRSVICKRSEWAGTHWRCACPPWKWTTSRLSMGVQGRLARGGAQLPLHHTTPTNSTKLGTSIFSLLPLTQCFPRSNPALPLTPTLRWPQEHRVLSSLTIDLKQYILIHLKRNFHLHFFPG